MLEALAGAGYQLGIATGKSRRGLMAVLEHHALLPFFMTLQTGDEPPGKPHPAMLLRAIAAAEVAPAATAMIGDTSFDMAMAVAAGALPIGVAWGYHPAPELTAAGAVHLVASNLEIPPLFASLVPSADAMKRRYREVAVAATDGGFGLALDGKPVNTPAGAPLAIPSRELAEAIAEEWSVQGEQVLPDTMPLMQLMATALDRVGPLRAQAIDELVR